MDIVILCNGLGNQMSQYAFFLQKKADFDCADYIIYCRDHNKFELGRVFNIEYKYSLRKLFLFCIFRLINTNKKYPHLIFIKNLLSRLGYSLIKENYNYSFNGLFLKGADKVNFYYGGWHNPKYFDKIKSEIFRVFKFNTPLDNSNCVIADKIRRTNSVSIHIRRGDYLDKNNIDMFGGVCTKEYFIKAIKYIKTNTINPHFFIFSNDMDWVRDNICIDELTLVDMNFGVNSWKDMYLMTLCKHNIISNSTFGWWGAWLNVNNNNITISPSRFLKNDMVSEIYPDNWVRLSEY